MKTSTGPRFAAVVLFALLFLTFPALALAASSTPERPPGVPEISGGAEAYGLRQQVQPEFVGPATEDDQRAPLFPGAGFDAYGFDDNGSLTGTYFIPPDPIGAAGRDRVIAVVNVGIEARDKTGVLLFRDSLQNFFAPAAAQGFLGTFTFDPKILYDPYADRFVVMSMERQFIGSGAATNESRILVAVSKTSAPGSATAADWWYYVMDTKVNIGGVDTWADYPGFEVDEEAIYITANQFEFPGLASTFGMRLWILPKAPFYSGGGASHTVHDPYGATGNPGFATTTMPAKVTGAGGVGPGIGTFLCSYSGLTFGGPAANEALFLIRVDDPLGAVSFVQEFVTIADIEDIGGAFGFPALPDAPQAGTATLIEVNDRRLLDLEWRDGQLWGCTTILPNVAFDPVNAGQTTAHWFQLDASAVTSSASPAGLVTAVQQGNAGGEDIDTGMYTFFPAIAVNPAGEMKLGFSGSSPNTFGSAYVAGRVPAEPAGFTGPTGVVRAGTDFYVRTFGGPRNRWGDYSGISLDPVDNQRFWLFNVFADTRGTAFGGEDGRWGTAWLECSFAPLTQPDLVVRQFRGPCCVSWDMPLGGFFVEVTNLGAGPSAATSLTLWASADAIVDPGDLPFANFPVPPLAPGTSVVVPVPPGLILPPTPFLGAAFFGVRVDDPDVVVESDESNNTAVAPTTVNRDPFACLDGRAYAALQGPVSVYTLPDGSGDPLSAAQFSGGGVFDATITAELYDQTGAPAPGLVTTLASTLGNLALCTGYPASDFPTDLAGMTKFSGPLHGGGWTRDGELLIVVGEGNFAIPGMVYGFPELLASNQNGDLFRVDPVSGAAAPLCVASASGSSTEIEWVVSWGQGWLQDANGALTGNLFDFNPCGPTSPTIPTNGYVWNGLEEINGRLYGAGITIGCGPSELWILDPPAGGYNFVGPTSLGPITGLAWNPKCGKLFGTTGCTSTFGPSQIVEIDVNTGLATPLFTTPTQLGSLEYDASGRLLAIGGQADGANLYEVDLLNQQLIPVGPTGIAPGGTGLTLASDAGIAIRVNSADISGDLVVNITDVGLFAGAFGNGTYDYQTDFVYDGTENISDVGRFALAIGIGCPAVPRAAGPVADAKDAELLLAFDRAGTRLTADLPVDTPTTAYVVARGAAARAGVRAWEGRLETTGNVVIDAVEFVEGSLELGRDGDRVVGLQQARANESGAVVLATVTLHVTDAMPASIALGAATTSSVGGAGPVLVADDDLERVRLAFTQESVLNGAREDTAPTIASVELRAVPNPFNPRTTFHLALDRRATVHVKVFDVSGRLVRTIDGGVLDAGAHRLPWDGDDTRGVRVTSGVYFARLLVDGVDSGHTEKVTLLK